jgi:flagellar export protein FliJ
MKFRFKLDSLLKHRGTLKDQAQKEYADAQAKVNECLAEIERMYDQIDESRLLISQTEKNAKDQQTPVFVSTHEFVDGQKIKIDRKRKEARELMVAAERKLEALIEATREYEVLKRLRERQHVEFKKVEKKRDVKRIDDLVTMRFKRSEP